MVLLIDICRGPSKNIVMVFCNKWPQRTSSQGNIKTLPEAQRTQGIDSLTWVISPAKYNATCIGSKFGQFYVVPLVLVQNLTTRWCHQNWFQIWPTGGAICISSKFDHQMASLESLALPHCLGLPYWHHQLILSWYLHQPESHQLSLNKWLSFREQDP